MPSVRHKNRLQLAKTITTQGFTPPVACDRCSSLAILCFVMSGHPGCSECVRHGRPCVPVSLESLNRAHLRLKSDIDDAMNERVEQAARLSKLDAKIIRLFKTLKQNESRTLAKVRCVAEELGDDVDGITDDKDPPEVPNLDSLLDSLSPSLFMDPGPPSQIAEASSRN